MAVATYLFVFNRQAKRYSQEAEAMIVAQASRLWHNPTITVVYTMPKTDAPEDGYVLDDFARQSRGVDGVVDDAN